MMSPHLPVSGSLSGKTGPLWSRCPPWRSPSLAIAGVFTTYGFFSELVRWQIVTLVGGAFTVAGASPARGSQTSAGRKSAPTQAPSRRRRLRRPSRATPARYRNMRHDVGERRMDIHDG